MAFSAPYWPTYLSSYHRFISDLLVRFDLELPVSGVFRWSARLNAPAASFWQVTWVTFLLMSHMSSSSF
ncbi:unnamed protein product [Brassica oleracea var. botrytis]